jgi:hypothetical protein
MCLSKYLTENQWKVDEVAKNPLTQMYLKYGHLSDTLRLITFIDTIFFSQLTMQVAVCDWSKCMANKLLGM